MDREDEDDDDKTKSLPSAKVNNVYSGSNTVDTGYSIKNKVESASSSTATSMPNFIYPASMTPSNPNVSINNSFTPNHSQVSSYKYLYCRCKFSNNIIFKYS